VKLLTNSDKEESMMKRLAAVTMIVAFAGAGLTPVAVATPDSTPGPAAGHAAKAKAYGKYCQNQSKKHVKGEKGTAFSRCVHAMARAARTDASPRQACKALSKKRVAGEKGTPFSRCVVAAAKLKHELEA
jgi:hypothetical protein